MLTKLRGWWAKLVGPTKTARPAKPAKPVAPVSLDRFIGPGFGGLPAMRKEPWPAPPAPKAERKAKRKPKAIKPKDKPVYCAPYVPDWTGRDAERFAYACRSPGECGTWVKGERLAACGPCKAKLEDYNWWQWCDSQKRPALYDEANPSYNWDDEYLPYLLSRRL